MLDCSTNLSSKNNQVHVPPLSNRIHNDAGQMPFSNSFRGLLVDSPLRRSVAANRENSCDHQSDDMNENVSSIRNIQLVMKEKIHDSHKEDDSVAFSSDLS